MCFDVFTPHRSPDIGGAGSRFGDTSSLIALVLGGSGETGRELVRELCASAAYRAVLLVGRRRVDDADWSSNPKVQQRVVDFDNLGRSQNRYDRSMHNEEGVRLNHLSTGTLARRIMLND